MLGVASAEGVEANEVIVERHLGADESMRPIGVDTPNAAEKRDVAALGCTTQEDDGSSWWGPEVEPPVSEKAAARGCVVDASGGTQGSGRYIARRTLFQSGQRRMLESRPDFALPSSVVAFDSSSLKARFSWRSKHWNDTKAEAQATDTTDGVFVLMCTLKDVVIVKLRIPGEADLAPVRNEHFDGKLRGDASTRPRCWQPSMQRDAVEHLYTGTFLDDKALYDVKAIQLASPRNELRQVPSSRRRGSAATSSAVERTASGEDSADGSHRRRVRILPGNQLCPNSLSTKFTEVAMVLQLTANIEHEVLDVSSCAMSRIVSCRPAIEPIDAVKAAPPSLVDPMLHRGQRYSKGRGNPAHRLAASYGAYHRTALRGAKCFWPSSVCSRFFDTRYSKRAPAAGTKQQWFLEPSPGEGTPPQT